MEQNHDKKSKRKENYDYIFRELDRQEQRRTKKYFTGPNGEDETKLVLKSFLPIVIYIALFFVLLVISGFNEKMSMVAVGMVFIGGALLASHMGKGIFRPHPILLFVFIIGLAICYAAAAIMYFEAHPQLNPTLFQKNSILGFGIGTAVIGGFMIVSEIAGVVICNTQVEATCVKTELRVCANGTNYGNITWQYEWDGVSYTRNTYNSCLEGMRAGLTDHLHVNPLHPKLIRYKIRVGSYGWGAFYIVAGIVAAFCSTLI